MVLQDIGAKILKTIEGVSFSTKVVDTEIETTLKEISRALLSADINVKVVLKLRENIKNKVLSTELPANANRKKILRKAVFEELCEIVDPKAVSYKPRKNKTNVILFVGLQGAGKTTSCSKLAYYYRKRGWKTGLVCADTFRPGAFAQINQNAQKINVETYGEDGMPNETEVAKRGVEHFREKGAEIIIVDSSGRNRQSQDLLDEIRRMEQVVSPDHVVLLMDATTGQSASEQARAFTETVSIGSIFLSKTDSNSKCGGAISGIAVTGCPISFIGTGEHMEDLEIFIPRAFISAMLGMGAIEQLEDKIGGIEQGDKEKMMGMLERKEFAFNDMKLQMKIMHQMGALKGMVSMVPKMNQMIGDKECDQAEDAFKVFAIIFKSMTDKEMASGMNLFTKERGRVVRIAKGAGVSIEAVEQLIGFCKKFTGILKKMGGGGGPEKMLQSLQKLL